MNLKRLDLIEADHHRMVVPRQSAQSADNLAGLVFLFLFLVEFSGKSESGQRFLRQRRTAQPIARVAPTSLLKEMAQHRAKVTSQDKFVIQLLKQFVELPVEFIWTRILLPHPVPPVKQMPIGRSHTG